MTDTPKPTDTEILDWMEEQRRVASEDGDGIRAIQFHAAEGYHEHMTLREAIALAMGYIPHPGWPAGWHDVPGRKQQTIISTSTPENSDDPS